MDRKINNIQLAWKLEWMLKTYKTCNLRVWFSKYEFYNKLLDGGVTNYVASSHALYVVMRFFCFWFSVVIFNSSQFLDYDTTQKLNKINWWVLIK